MKRDIDRELNINLSHVYKNKITFEQKSGCLCCGSTENLKSLSMCGHNFCLICGSEQINNSLEELDKSGVAWFNFLSLNFNIYSCNNKKKTF